MSETAIAPDDCPFELEREVSPWRIFRGGMTGVGVALTTMIGVYLWLDRALPEGMHRCELEVVVFAFAVPFLQYMTLGTFGWLHFRWGRIEAASAVVGIQLVVLVAFLGVQMFRVLCCFPNLDEARIRVDSFVHAIDLYETKTRGPRVLSIPDLIKANIVPRERFRDPWGQSYRLEPRADGWTHVCSAGEDRLFDTGDDICGSTRPSHP